MIDPYAEKPWLFYLPLDEDFLAHCERIIAELDELIWDIEMEGT